MSCKYDSINLEDLGIHVDEICEEKVSEIITELAEAFRLPIQMLTSDEVKEIANETYMGIHPDDREDLLNLTMTALARQGIADSARDADTISNVMQDVATEFHLAAIDE